MERETMMPGDNEEKGEEREEDRGVGVDDNLEVTTKKIREMEKEFEERKGDDAWREQK